NPFSTSVSTRLLVEFSTPENPRNSVAGNPDGKSEKIGTPSMTVASHKNLLPRACARAVKDSYAWTTGPLLAEMACAPCCSAAVKCWIAGCPLCGSSELVSKKTSARDCSSHSETFCGVADAAR